MKTIGSYRVTADSETFRIFPKNRQGVTIPVTRINHFLYLTHEKTGQLVSFKHYLHQKRWYWRDSRDNRPTDENAVVSEVARMLFDGDKAAARSLVMNCAAGVAI